MNVPTNLNNAHTQHKFLTRRHVNVNVHTEIKDAQEIKYSEEIFASVLAQKSLSVLHLKILILLPVGVNVLAPLTTVQKARYSMRQLVNANAQATPNVRGTQSLTMTHASVNVQTRNLVTSQKSSTQSIALVHARTNLRNVITLLKSLISAPAHVDVPRS